MTHLALLLLVLVVALNVSTAFVTNSPAVCRAKMSQLPRLQQTTTSLKMLFNFPSASSSPGVNIPANKKICVITGTTSGLGKETLRSLLKTDDYFVVCGVRDTEKMEELAAKENFDKSKYAIVELDLGES